MADWYVSSVAWNALPQFAASGVYTVGQIVRPLTAPAAGHEYAFRCTTAGTASTEPAWPAGNAATVATGGATFTNVSGQSAYGWSAAAGTLNAMTNVGTGTGRAVAGDRVFLSSDHAESGFFGYDPNSGASGQGAIQIVSVNRAGSVPPVAADITSGAAITSGATANFALNAWINIFWQGITFTTTSTAALCFNNGTCTKTNYLKNCTIVLTITAGAIIRGGNSAKVVFDNTTVRFGAITQYISAALTSWDFVWINTSAPFPGSIPATLFNTNSANIFSVTCRGVDLSAITGTLVGNSSASTGVVKVLLDSCRIASGAVRYGAPVVQNSSDDEIELINCYDGASVLNERWTVAGTVTTDRGTYRTTGAQYDLGNYALKMQSNANGDFTTIPLDAFTFDLENTLTGVSRTATIEIISGGTLNNTDIRLLLEYMGASGSPIASFVDSLASVLTAPSALPASSNSWAVSIPVAWNQNDLVNIGLTNNNLSYVGTGSNGAVRAAFGATTGKYYWEFTINSIGSSGNVGVGLGTLTTGLSAAANTGANAVVLNHSGIVYVNGVDSGVHFGVLSAGMTFCVAVDIAAQLIWYRIGAAGQWNASGTANPATGAGGASFSALTGGAIYPLGTIFAAGDAVTSNFGAGTYTGTVPSGFASPPSQTTLSSKQILQVTFTPQRAGRIRGVVRLGKVSTTVWVNPQVSIS